MGEASAKAISVESGVSFAGKSLKLDTEEDAKEVVDEIDKCKKLEFLNLEGNTLGVEACKAVAKALESHSEFKRALWKDMFTGRMKTEIPKALNHLGYGLVTAQACLTELDLSDNAFGPVGVEGLAALLKSSCCFALEQLRLNNNGLGITGGRLLAGALTECYKKSKEQGKPLALKVFIAGRNRLENDGATALAEVFKMIGSLEEISMPQNGIYHKGITALSEAFSKNKNLKILNLNDNTIGPKGAEAIAKALPNLQCLREINFGDCLLKTKGALLLANALESGHQELETLNLDSNEIKKEGGLQLVKALGNKSKLKTVMLDANIFGSEGKDEIIGNFRDIGKEHVLGSLSDNEEEDSDEEEEELESSKSSSICDQESFKEESIDEDLAALEKKIDEYHISAVEYSPSQNVTIEDFLKTPCDKNYMALGENRDDLFLNKVKNNGQFDEDIFMQVLMKIGSLCNNSNSKVKEMALASSELIYRELFTRAQELDKVSIVNNLLLINLGLIKSESKSKPMWNPEGCLQGLYKVVEKNYIPQSTKNTLSVFLQKEVDNNKADFEDIKRQILSSLK